MNEPAVTLTDFGLAVECAILATLVGRQAPPPLRRWWVLFFVAVGAGALFGGLVHGYYSDHRTLGWRLLWYATMIALGVAATAVWSLGAYVQLGERMGALLRRSALWLLAVYVLIVLTISSRFIVAILMYLPATLFLLVALIDAYRRSPLREEGIAIGGLVLTLIAAAVQAFGVAVHPVYFDHNALYHLIQAIALILLYLGARGIRPATVREAMSESL